MSNGQLDAKRYQYLKKWMLSGTIDVDGGRLTSRNTDKWDEVIDSHINRLEISGEFQKGEKVYVCDLRPEQPMWLKHSDSLMGVVLDSWKDKNSDKIIYKIQYSHNNAVFKCEENYILSRGVFDGVTYPEWIESASYSTFGFMLHINNKFDPDSLLAELITILKTEKSHQYGEIKIEVYGSNPYLNVALTLNKKMTFRYNNKVISKSGLLNELIGIRA